MKGGGVSILLALGLAGCGTAGPARVEVDASRAASDEGIAAYHAKVFDQAIAAFTRAIELNPSNHDAYRMRAKARLRKIDRGDGAQYLQETSKAFDDLNAAISIYPLAFDAYYHRALAYASVARYRDAAFDLMNHCLKLRPEDGLSHLLLAQVYDQGFEGKEDLALKHYLAYSKSAGAATEPHVMDRVRELQAKTKVAGQASGDEARAAELFEQAMALVGTGQKAEALKLLTAITVKYGGTQFAKRNEALIPLVIRSLNAEAKPSEPRSGQ